MNNPIFQLKNVNFAYLGKYPALCNINLDIFQGEKICIIGANGSGKSTLLHLLDGLIFPDQGIFEAFAEQINESKLNEIEFSQKFRKRVGLVLQNPDVALFCPTVEEDIIFGPLQLGVDHSEVKARLKELSQVFGIEHLLSRSVHQLSLGEQKKVSIAGILAIDPDVLLLDEPTSGLDPLTSRQIVDIIIEANQKGKTVITATHDLHIVEEIADKVCILSKDKSIVKLGPANELLSDMNLLRDHNLIHIHKHTHAGQIHTHPHQHLEHHAD